MSEAQTLLRFEIDSPYYGTEIHNCWESAEFWSSETQKAGLNLKSCLL